MNVETSVGFLKYIVLRLFPKYSQSYVNLNADGLFFFLFGCNS